MYIEKLKSGKYRISQMEGGKRYRLVVDYKPKKAEAQRLILELIDKAPAVNPGMTFDEAAANYIQSKSNVLSPSTIAGYEALRRRLAEKIDKDFSCARLNNIDQQRVQKLINAYAADHSAKSVRNLHGFISAVMRFAMPKLVLTTTLPQKKRPEPIIPDELEVQAVLSELRGTEYEVPVMLAAFGLRRSEICALQLSDFDFEENTVHICRAKLLDKNREWVIVDRTKTPESTRTVFLPDFVCQAVKSKGYVYKRDPSTLSDVLRRIETENGIRKFSLHKLRHYYASMAHAANVPEAYILDQGGWSTPYVMRSVYRHTMDKKMKEISKDVLVNIGSSLLPAADDSRG